jgi:hypothetical protein
MIANVFRLHGEVPELQRADFTVTHRSTAPEDLRKPKMRMIAAAIETLDWPKGVPPAWLSKAERNERIRSVCLEHGVHRNGLPGDRTIDRYFTGC